MDREAVARATLQTLLTAALANGPAAVLPAAELARQAWLMADCMAAEAARRQPPGTVLPPHN